MVLYIIGLGLGNEKDITIRGLEAVKSSTHIFLECYTSILAVDKSKLESFYGKPITIADRNFVECQAEEIYQPAKHDNVSLLVVGDPVCATTHTDIILRAQEIGVKVELVHNASAMGAAGCCGLQLYNFGQTVSIPFFEENWRPRSFYPKIKYNRGGGMHTLCLLDIKVKEPDFDAMMRGKTVFLPPRYMSVNVAAEQLMEAELEEGGQAYDPDATLCVGMARLGQTDGGNGNDNDGEDQQDRLEGQKIVAGTLQELKNVDFGKPLHCLVICGEVHDLELEFLKQFMVENSKFRANDHLDACQGSDAVDATSQTNHEEEDEEGEEDEENRMYG